MKFFSRKNSVKIIIITLLITLLCNFLIPNLCLAEDDESDEGLSTDVSDALCDIFCAIPDAGFYILQFFFSQHQEDVEIEVQSDIEEMKGGGWLNYIPFVTMIWDGEFELPNIRVTPYTIFSNQVPLLNANFFGEPKKRTDTYYYVELFSNGQATVPAYTATSKEEAKEYIKKTLNNDSSFYQDNDRMYDVWGNWIKEFLEGDTQNKTRRAFINTRFKAWINAEVVETREGYSNIKDYDLASALVEDAEGIKNSAGYTNYVRDYIFRDITSTGMENYNRKLGYAYKPDSLEEGTNLDSLYSEHIKEITHEATDSVSVLKPIISKWYGILRSIAVVGLLIVLVYTSIRMIISSASSEKARYKALLKDWAIGMILVFVLHYIMSFTMLFTDRLIDLFEHSDVEEVKAAVPSDLECDEGDDIEDTAAFKRHFSTEETSDGTIGRWTCNSVEYIRYMCLMQKGGIAVKFGYIVIYTVLCFQTFIFAWQYLRRVIYMAILTLLAPLIALTYPIDKMADKQAQGFNMWLKEYVFNALIQLIHLLLYFLIITSAGALANNNPIYALVALLMISQIEKLLRKMFSVGKTAKTVDTYGGAAGTALIMAGMDKLSNISVGSGRDNKKDDVKLYQNTQSLDPIDVLKDSSVGGNSTSSNNEANQASGPRPKSPTMIELEEQLARAGQRLSDARRFPVSEDEEFQARLEYSDLVRRIAEQRRAEEEAEAANANNGGNNANGNNGAEPNNNNNGNGAELNNNNNGNGAEPNNNNNIRRNPPRRITNSRGYALKYATKRALSGSGKRVIRGFGHGAVKLGGSVLGASIGLAAGIASGDPGKVVKYTVAGGYATGKLSDKIATSAIHEKRSVVNDYRRGKASIDPEYAYKQKRKQFRKDSDNKVYIQSRYADKEQRDEMLNIADQVIPYGFEDVEEISAIYEMTRDGNKSVEQAMAIAKMSKKMGNILQKPKLRKEWKEKLMEDGFEEGNAKSVINDVERFQKLK